MSEEKNAYEIVGTNKIVIDMMKDEFEKDRFIREKKKRKIDELSRKIEITQIKIKMSKSYVEKQEMQRKISGLEEEKTIVEKEYIKISDEEHRDKYNAYLEMLDKMGGFQYGTIKATQQPSNSKTAYQILGTSQEECGDTRKPIESIDRDLLKRRDGLIELARARCAKNIRMKRKNLFSAQQKLDSQIGILQEAYEKVATKERRESYNAKLEEIESQKRLERIYNKRNIYNPRSIVALKYKDMTKKNEKNNLLRITMLRDNEQKIFLQQVGKIKYKDSFGLQGEVGEYKITRLVGSRVKIDKIYITGLNISDLGIDKNTGKLKNEKYYQFIVNEMLSEESIEQCLKYNNGYLGEPLYDKENGKYFRFLAGREDLSAVMKYYEEKNKGQGSLGENEGESYEQ